MNIYQLIFLLIACMAISCQPSKQVDEKRIKESLSSEEAQQNWDKVSSAETVSALKELKKNTKEVVSDRRKERLTDEADPAQVNEPIHHDEQVVHVEVRVSSGIQSYEGPYHFTQMDALAIRGTIQDQASCDIYCKLPRNSLESRLQVNREYALSYESQIVSGSNSLQVILTEGRAPLLVSIEEGSTQPFQKNYEGKGLSIRQIVSEGGQGNGIEVTFNQQSFTLNEGEKSVRKGPEGDVEFFLMTSYANPTPLLGEGAPYYIRLYAYAL